MKEFCFTPISGGYFVSQVAQIAKILEAREKSQKIKKTQFDCYFGASGGSLANLIATFFTENSHSLERVLYSIKKEMFIQSWYGKSGSFFQSLMFSFFYNGIYKTGSGAEEMFEKLAPPNHFSSDLTPEMWILTFNTDNSKAKINSSKSKTSSIFKNQKLEDYVEKVDFDFVKQNKKIIRSIIASTSIPGVKEEVKIDEGKFVDGGVVNASPGTYFNEAIIELDLKKEITPPYHFYYILPYDVKGKKFQFDNNHWMINIFSFVKIMTTFSTVNDRKNVLENWLRLVKTTQSQCKKLFYNNVTLHQLMIVLENYHHLNYFICFHTEENNVNITSFNETELKKVFQICYKTLSFEILIKE